MDPLLDARLVDAALPVSNDGRTGDDVAAELVDERRWPGAVFMEWVSESEVFWEESEAWSAGKGFLYASFGILTCGGGPAGRAAMSAGAMVRIIGNGDDLTAINDGCSIGQLLAQRQLQSNDRSYVNGAEGIGNYVATNNNREG